jgi:hypothetical protein
VAKKQTRRSISVSRKVYDRLKVHLEANGGSMSAFTEQLITHAIDEAERRRYVGNGGGRDDA